MPSDVSYMPLPSHNGPGGGGTGFHRTSSLSRRSRLSALFTRRRIFILLGILSGFLLIQLFFFSDDTLTQERLAALKSYYPWQHPTSTGVPDNVQPVSSSQTAAAPTVAPAPPSTPSSVSEHIDANKGVAPIKGSNHLTQDAFPAVFKGSQPDWDKIYPDGNPHQGVIPTRLLAILEKEPISERPPRPLNPPTITAEMWKVKEWSPSADGSRTTFEDNENADKQAVEADWRNSPFNKWRPPLSDLRTPPQSPLPKVQFPFADPSRHSGNNADPAAEELARKRQKLVRNAFLHAWEGYKRLAWGHDELKPVSAKPNDNFNGWGATPVDVLDTLLVMDLPQEYDYARQHARDIDFHLVGGGRSAYGSADGRIPVFETAIRYLGGLLSAYDLSGDELMKHRAEELAQLIMPAFETTSGLPVGRIKMQDQGMQHMSTGSVVLAEVGSLLLEFTRLWQVTGNRTYFDRVQRVTDYLEHNITSGKSGALLGTNLYPDTHSTSGTISFGGMADSYYEYLIKEYQLMGGRLKQYGRMYSAAIESAKKILIRDVQSVPNASSLLNIGEVYAGSGEDANPYMKLEHLSSFAGGMLGLGSKLLPERQSDLELAIRYTDTCYWAYNSSLTGIGPEDLSFDGGVFHILGKKETKKSDTLPRSLESAVAAEQERDTAAAERSSPTSEERQEVLESVAQLVKKAKTEGKAAAAVRSLTDSIKALAFQDRATSLYPVGVASSAAAYRNRPETIESVFYMWRITGDPEWRERGWQMFSSWVVHSMTDHGFSSLENVYAVPATKGDSQESYTFAETFKYYYLLFSPPELISLDHYVFTTEAHPLLVPQNGKYTRPGQGPRKFWTPSDSHEPSKASGLYSGGEGGLVGGLTHVQKAFVYQSWKSKNRQRALLELAERAATPFGDDVVAEERDFADEASVKREEPEKKRSSASQVTPRHLMQALVDASQADQAATSEAQALAGNGANVGNIPTILNAEVLQTVMQRLIEADQVAEDRVWALTEEEEHGTTKLDAAAKLKLMSARAEERADVDRFVEAIRGILTPPQQQQTATTTSAAEPRQAAPELQQVQERAQEQEQEQQQQQLEARADVVDDADIWERLLSGSDELLMEERDGSQEEYF
ncbi:hypothetical protein OC861_001943 [Tilletia horrida]|nr:hypothetical protein OC861_001943 [Tilletia horrida]